MAAETNKKTKGRQKIEMKQIEKEQDKLTAFSKRRSGIYKKASELVTLTGAEIAFLVFSPAGKPFTFAHPSMEAIADRFLSRQGQSSDSTDPMAEAHRMITLEELNQQHDELLQQLDVEKKRENELQQKIKGEKTNGWWDAPIEKQSIQQLVEMEAAFKNIQMQLINSLREKTNGASSSSSQPQPQPEPELEPLPQAFIDQPPPDNTFPFASHPNFPPNLGHGPSQM